MLALLFSLVTPPAQGFLRPLNITILTFGCHRPGDSPNPPSQMFDAGLNLALQTQDQEGQSRRWAKSPPFDLTIGCSIGRIDQWQKTAPPHIRRNTPSIASLATPLNKLVAHPPHQRQTTNCCDDSICP